MMEISSAKVAFLVAALCVLTTVASQAQTFKTVTYFDGVDGDIPNGPLVQAPNGNFYGTTFADVRLGEVFAVSPDGQVKVLYTFCLRPPCTDGIFPVTGLVQAGNEHFYGTTASGGLKNGGGGTVFEITAAGNLTTLYRFCTEKTCGSGSGAATPLVLATNGNLYGTTQDGGGGVTNGGTIFRISPTGELATLYRFCSQSPCPDGQAPAGLTEGLDGNFYGVTYGGGTSNGGTVFKISPTGQLTTLYRFCSQTNCTDGYSPGASLLRVSSGDFYGTTRYGGANARGNVFRITPAGELTTIYSFCSQPKCSDGSDPDTPLILGTDGNFYGTTDVVSGVSSGTVFEITPTGQLTTLYTFCSQSRCLDGYGPSGGLVQATDGTFYGTTGYGGILRCSAGCGTIFKVSTGLAPFIKTLPTFGKVGKEVIVFGDNLSGTTGVSFNGTAATFKITSGKELTAIVPMGATTGTVEVVTPRGTLSSNVAFQVLP